MKTKRQVFEKLLKSWRPREVILTEKELLQARKAWRREYDQAPSADPTMKSIIDANSETPSGSGVD